MGSSSHNLCVSAFSSVELHEWRSGQMQEDRTWKTSWPLPLRLRRAQESTARWGENVVTGLGSEIGMIKKQLFSAVWCC